MKQMVYFDNNASTPIDKRVQEAMWPYLTTYYGNASAVYRWGRLSRNAIETAREQVATLVNAQPSEVVFTSGGTEANNFGIKTGTHNKSVGTILAGSTEHPSIIEPLKVLTARGWKIRFLPVMANGQPDFSVLDEMNGVRTTPIHFATLMLANHETGVIHSIEPLIEKMRKWGGTVHVDAVQAAGKIPICFRTSGADTLSLSAHKLYGPKGIGAFVYDRKKTPEPLLYGGGQERGLRSGTENVAGIVGFGKAAELAYTEWRDRYALLLAFRRQLEMGLRAIPGLTLFSEDTERLPNTLLFTTRYYDGETLVLILDQEGFAVSSGSACASGGRMPSPVLTAMGISADIASRAIRVSFGKSNTSEEIDHFLRVIKRLHEPFSHVK